MDEVKFDEITDKGMTIVANDGTKRFIEADSIIPVTSWVPNLELLKQFQGKVPELYAIGDCTKSGLIIDAIADGYRVAKIL